MIKIIRVIFIGFIICFAGHVEGQSVLPAFLRDYNKNWVDSIFNSMTLDEKIGQLLMPRGNYSGKPHEIDTLLKWVETYKIGGLVFFASNPTTQVNITNKIQAVSKIPLIIGQDFEWGVGMRLDSTDRFPYAIALGAIQGHEDLIEEMGTEIARQCKRLGVHINYAPVVDINNNPDNPVINFRSFGSDKDNVASKGLAYMRGMQNEKLFCTAKHFPGHGDTGLDSHFELPVILHDIKRLTDVELFPFQKLISHGLSGVMTAHLEVPALESNKGLASTFSKNVLSKLLKEDLKFQGLVFTDAMDMQGAVKNFPKGEAMVKALLAGNDVLETFLDVPGTVAAIKTAVISGKIPETLLDSKVKKILKAKSWVGLDHYKPVALQNLVEDLNTIASDVLNSRLTEKSITCLKNENHLLPVKDLSLRVAIVSMESDSVSNLSKMILNYTEADYYYIPKNAPDSIWVNIKNELHKYDLIIASVHLIDIRASKKYGLTASNIAIISELALNPKVVLCLLGNPFILGKIPELAASKTLILGYQQNIYTENAIAQMIFGALVPEGKLPVEINGEFRSGMGLTFTKLDRLSYGVPELAGVNRERLNFGIDSLMNLGLNQKAFPGGVVQIAKDGKVIFTRGYGYHTYEDAANATKGKDQSKEGKYGFIDDAMDNPVSTNFVSKKAVTNSAPKGMVMKQDIYDLASITKVAASTLAVMQLISENKLNLESPLVDYFPTLKNTDKANLLMKNLLTHSAGLKPWIPFWRDAIDTIATMQRSLELNPELERECIVHIKKPGFFGRLFGKKPIKKVMYLESLTANPNLWSKMLKASTRIWKPNIFSDTKKGDFTVQVDQNLFLNRYYRKTIMNQIANSSLDTNKQYVYSDLHFYLYPDIIRSLTGQSFDKYLEQTYRSLGANSICFNPISKFPPARIVPTEFDSLFRKNLIHGFVHDEGAAMMGGISGHAGLFGNANDLTKLLQMFLQKGSYGGSRYVLPEVIDYCTSYQFPEDNNRRGIGFDKKDFNFPIKNAPKLASERSYGHSGFTGTYAWVDPEYNLVYVVLTNRVYPSRDNLKINELNIRTEIGNEIIKCIQEGLNKRN